MKKWFTVITLIVLGMALFAEEGLHHKKHHEENDNYLATEIEAVLDSAEDQSLGSLEVGELSAILGQLSVARQKDAHIQHSRQLSFMFPGLGQFRNDDKVGGALFLTANLVVTAGTLIGAYFLLPADLQFDTLDYFYDTFDTIKESWKSHTLVDMLPAMGVMAGGWLVKGGLRLWSANHAGKLAKANIESGKITFEPTLLMELRGPGSMGFGMRMMY